MREPTGAQWRDLHVAFSEFCAVEPWEVLDDTDLIVVEHPSREYMGYCSVMGGSGLEYGLSVFMGDEGLAGFLDIISDEDDPGPHTIDRMNVIMGALDDRKNLEARERAAIRGLGLRYHGRSRWPMFRRMEPGYVPWRLNEEETLFMTAALRNIADVVSRVAAGHLSLDRDDEPDSVLTRVFRGGAWRDRWLPLEVPEPTVPPYDDAERLERIAGKQARGASVWEVGISYMHATIQEERDSRPYFPTVALIMDRSTSMALGSRALGASPSTEERQNVLVELLEQADHLPSGIVVDSEETALLIASVVLRLDIGLSVGPTPALDDMREWLMEEME